MTGRGVGGDIIGDGGVGLTPNTGDGIGCEGQLPGGGGIALVGELVRTGGGAANDSGAGALTLEGALVAMLERQLVGGGGTTASKASGVSARGSTRLFEGAPFDGGGAGLSARFFSTMGVRGTLARSGLDVPDRAPSLRGE